MSKKFSFGAVIALMAITAAVTVSLTYVVAMNRFNSMVADVNERQAMYAKLSEIDQNVRQNFIGKIDETKLSDGISTGYIAGLLDSHGQYMNAAKYKEYLSGNSGKYIGIGVETVQDADSNMEVTEVFPGSAAEKGGVLKGDVIVKVDDKEVKRIGYSEALTALDGTVGSSVKISVLRSTVQKQAAGTASSQAPSTAADAAQAQTQTMNFTLTRAEYQTSTVSATVINGNVGYITISNFTAQTVDQFSKALAAIKKTGIVGLVIDVRNNPGTSAEAAAKILDTLVPAGNLLSSQDKAGKTTVLYTSDAKSSDLPISVITNKNTLGAAEIFAGVIKDYKTGQIVGEKTAGRGGMEQVFPLSDGSAIVISVADYVLPKSGKFTGTGIDADIPIELSEAQNDQLSRKSLVAEQDPQLQAAVTALVRQGAKVGITPGANAQQTASGAAPAGTQSGTAQ